MKLEIKLAAEHLRCDSCLFQVNTGNRRCVNAEVWKLYKAKKSYVNKYGICRFYVTTQVKL